VRENYCCNNAFIITSSDANITRGPEIPYNPSVLYCGNLLCLAHKTAHKLEMVPPKRKLLHLESAGLFLEYENPQYRNWLRCKDWIAGEKVEIRQYPNEKFCVNILPGQRMESPPDQPIISRIFFSTKASIKIKTGEIS